ncbi:MAG: hypothetical protein SF029_21965 [bacterium]|nr:hypothetical protein [bacterium]
MPQDYKTSRNNLVIVWQGQSWSVVAPDGTVVGRFKWKPYAISFAESNFDYCNHVASLNAKNVHKTKRLYVYAGRIAVTAFSRLIFFMLQLLWNIFGMPFVSTVVGFLQIVWDLAIGIITFILLIIMLIITGISGIATFATVVITIFTTFNVLLTNGFAEALLTAIPRSIVTFILTFISYASYQIVEWLSKRI